MLGPQPSVAQVELLLRDHNVHPLAVGCGLIFPVGRHLVEAVAAYGYVLDRGIVLDC